MGNSEWVIIQLNEAMENISYGDIKSAIANTFGNTAEYFIPIHHEKIGSYTSTSTLIQGYVFVKDSLDVREALSSVGDNRLFARVLMRGKRIETIPASAVASMRRRLKNSLKRKFEIGTTVRIREGALKDLTGDVVSLEEDGLTVIVKISRYSRDILAPVPATLVEEASEYVA